MSKKLPYLLIMALMAIVIVACQPVKTAALPNIQSAPLTAPLNESPDTARTITVVGEGEVNLQPDTAMINVGAEARAETVSTAKAEVETNVAAIIATLREMDIAESDIQTSHYSIHFEREQMPMMPAMPDQPVPEIREGYYVSNMLRITIRDVELAGELLDAVVQAGANQVHGVTYTVSDETTWQSQTRALAMADARSRAEELAELAEVELGEVLAISEIVGGVPASFLRGGYGLGGGGGIAPGELEFSMQIQVMFAVE
jgi:uncharacterized protein YggE